jgi:hypothetical protein
MHHCGRSKKLLKTWKSIRVGEARNSLKLGSARNSLKLGSTSPSLNQEPHFLVDALSWEAEENCKSHVEGIWE